MLDNIRCPIPDLGPFNRPPRMVVYAAKEMALPGLSRIVPDPLK